MRTLAMVALAALLAACGGDGDDDGNGGGGGGGGGSSSVTLTGPLAATLTSGFYGTASGSCDVEGTTVAFAGGFVAVSTASNLCSEALAGRDVANATILFINLARFSLTGTSTSLDAATYPLDIPAIDATGGRVAFVSLTKSGTSAGAGLGCTVDAEPPAVSGSVTVTSVSATSISGTVSVTFDDGTAASGSFTATTCGITFSVDPTTCEPIGLPDPGTCTG